MTRRVIAITGAGGALGGTLSAHFAEAPDTDLVLSDPEDGTTEKAYGQLPGAINRGHVSGQCHTAGMRDPAQYRDSSRNATMNANAAR